MILVTRWRYGLIVGGGRRGRFGRGLSLVENILLFDRGVQCVRLRRRWHARKARVGEAVGPRSLGEVLFWGGIGFGGRGRVGGRSLVGGCGFLGGRGFVDGRGFLGGCGFLGGRGFLDGRGLVGRRNLVNRRCGWGSLLNSSLSNLHTRSLLCIHSLLRPLLHSLLWHFSFVRLLRRRIRRRLPRHSILFPPLLSLLGRCGHERPEPEPVDKRCRRSRKERLLHRLDLVHQLILVVVVDVLDVLRERRRILARRRSRGITPKKVHGVSRSFVCRCWLRFFRGNTCAPNIVQANGGTSSLFHNRWLSINRSVCRWSFVELERLPERVLLLRELLVDPPVVRAPVLLLLHRGIHSAGRRPWSRRLLLALGNFGGVQRVGHGAVVRFVHGPPGEHIHRATEHSAQYVVLFVSVGPILRPLFLLLHGT